VKTIRQKLLNWIVTIAVVVIVFALGGVAYGNRAQYRSVATCKALVARDRSIGQVGVERFEDRLSEDTRLVTFVHRGALPFSRYWCTVKVRNDVVVEGENSHHWVW
jgi:hypothetical protein